MSLIVFSQKIMLIENDTNLCFTLSRSKFLLKQYYLNEEKISLLNFSEQEIILYKQKSDIFEQQKEEYIKIINNFDNINQNQNALILSNSQDIKFYKKQVKIEKIKTYTAISGGFLSSIILTYFYFIKK
jgi:Icc-related predicted phosphoesterase